MRLSQKITRWSSSRKIETYVKNRNYQVVITTHFFKQFYFVILYFSGAERGTFSLCHSLFRNRSELNVLLSTSSFCIKSRPFFCKVITQKKKRAQRGKCFKILFICRSENQTKFNIPFWTCQSSTNRLPHESIKTT